MTKRTDIDIEIPGPEMKITVTPPAEAGLPYKAVIRIDWSHVYDAENTDWERLMDKLSDWLTATSVSASNLRLQLSKVPCPAPPDPPDEDHVSSVLPTLPPKEIEVLEATGWPSDDE